MEKDLRIVQNIVSGATSGAIVGLAFSRQDKPLLNLLAGGSLGAGVGFIISLITAK